MMDSVDFAGKRVLVASLLPDTGHLTPLFQIAEALEKRGAEVLAIVPSEAKNVAGRFAIRTEYLGEVISGQAKIALKNYSQAGEMSRLFFRGPLYTQRYMIPLQAGGLQKFLELVDRALNFSPDVIIADNHLFAEEYRELAYRLNCQLILNYSKGSHYAWQDQTLWFKNQNRLFLESRRFIKRIIPKIHYKIEKLFFSHKLAKRKALNRFVIQSRASYQYKTESQINETTITTGTALLEKKYLGKKIRSMPSSIRIFGPIGPQDVWNKDQELLEWLDAEGEAAVVYIATGTMVSPPQKVIQNLVDALVGRGVRVLIATRDCPFDLAGDEEHGVLWKPWVPQSAVLSHPSVIGFATHAGSTSIQEALWFGKPVLCLPVLWDQFYFAWLAEQLGFGIWADGRGSPFMSIEQRVDRLLSDPSLKEKAEDLSRELRSQAGIESILEYIFSLILDRPEQLSST